MSADLTIARRSAQQQMGNLKDTKKKNKLKSHFSRSARGRLLNFFRNDLFIFGKSKLALT
jgi:hypothetical protein